VPGVYGVGVHQWRIVQCALERELQRPVSSAITGPLYLERRSEIESAYDLTIIAGLQHLRTRAINRLESTQSSTALAGRSLSGVAGP
jgi:hypothetical protein